MPQHVQLYRSTVTGHTPSPGALLPGELALNTTDKALFFGTGSSVVNLSSTIASAALNATPLAGLTATSAAPITTGDTALAALAKLQAQISANLSVIPSGGSAMRSLPDKLRDVLTVRDFGAVGDGVADDVAAFEAAAAYSTDVFVPKGTYRLSRKVDPQGRDIFYRMTRDAVISGAPDAETLLGGALIRANTFKRQTFGMYDQGAVLSVIGTPGDLGAGVTGFTTPSQQATYNTRDGVALYTEHTVPPPVFSSSTTTSYTATTVTSSTAATHADIRVGMFIITRHSTWYSGQITAFSADAKTFTVSGWFQRGNTAAGQVPANNVAFDICSASEVWGANFNVFTNAASFQTAGASAIGLEIGLFQNTAAFNPATQLPNVAGINVVELGSYGGVTGYLHRGQSHYGFATAGARQAGYLVYDNASLANGPVAAPVSGFRCEAHCPPFTYIPQGNPTWLVADNGHMDIGSATGGTIGIDFHALSDNPAGMRDYDVRLAAFNNGSGGADFQIIGATFLHLPPSVPNTVGLNFGSPSLSWGNAWFANVNLTGGVSAFTGLELGNPAAASTPFIDFHVLGTSTDYDVRLTAANTGGGTASLYVQGALQMVTPAILPSTNGNSNFGSPGAVWGNAWITNVNVLGGLAAVGNLLTMGGSITASAGNVSGVEVLATGGRLIASSYVQAAGYLCRAGLGGALGSNQFNFYWNGSGMQLYVDALNLGVVTTTSDARYKQDVAPMAGTALDRVMALRPIEYEWADKDVVRADGVRREGFLAQELGAVVPSAVHGDPDDENAMLSVNLLPVVALLTKAVQELRAEVAVLRG